MFGIGYYKNAPGTLASFVTCLIYYILMSNLIPFVISTGIFWFIFAVLFIASVSLINEYSKNFKKTDPKEIVIDEFLGQSIPILYLTSQYPMETRSIWPISGLFPERVNYQIDEPTVILLFLIPFVFFRLFDIYKPYPINLIDEKMKNCWGIVLDDIIAGIYAAAASHVFMLILIYLFW
jgi:phosphatidylglycerophosphatase A